MRNLLSHLWNSACEKGKWNIWRAKGFFLVVPTAAFGFLVAFAINSWLEPPLPRTPVPQLSRVGETTVPLHVELVAGGDRANLVLLSSRTVGRVAKGLKSGSIWHQWPGFYAEARFQGETVTLAFNDTVNRFRVLVDGGLNGNVELSRPGLADLRISGLMFGSHDIRLEKISESSSLASFDGFFVPVNGKISPPPSGPSRLIEFIGDSDTVGYGSTAQRRDCTDEQVFAATDATQTFGPRVAAYFGADYRMIARSGIGLLGTDRGNDPGQSMPALYSLALVGEQAGTAMPEPAADIIVVGLGSNDFRSDLHTDGSWRDVQKLRHGFRPALMEFLFSRHRQSPAALLVLLAFGEYGQELIGAYRAAEDTLRKNGARVVSVVLPKLERRGCHWHPSPQDHALIADRLITAISSKEYHWSK